MILSALSGSEACAETLTAECSGCCVLLPAEGFGMALRVKKTKSRGKAAYRTLYSLVYESDLFYPPGGKRDPDLFEWVYNKRCEIFFPSGWRRDQSGKKVKKHSKRSSQTCPEDHRHWWLWLT